MADSCHVCDKHGGKTCSRCKQVRYCSVDHEKEDWKRHKSECFPPGATCTRCLQVIPSPPGECLISHPNHLRVDEGSTTDPNGLSCRFSCMACSGIYVIKGKRKDNAAEMPIVSGTEYCYKGPHTVEPLKENDQRRSFDDVVVISGDLNTMQEKIEALDSNEKVRVLKLTSGGCFSDEYSMKLAIRLPNLEEVVLEDIDMQEITLNDKLTPKVKKIFMRNPSQSEEPNFTILCPLLEDASIFYWGPGDDTWVTDMLEAATVLKQFDSYKLRVGYLKFASNHLESIRLHRAECLELI